MTDKLDGLKFNVYRLYLIYRNGELVDDRGLLVRTDNINTVYWRINSDTYTRRHAIDVIRGEELIGSYSLPEFTDWLTEIGHFAEKYDYE